MATNIVQLSPAYFPSSSIGRPLALADIYVGEPDLDPEIVANQKTLSVLEGDGTVVAVTQPISTNAGGVPIYDGSPVTLLVAGDYSLKVLDSAGSQIYYVPYIATRTLLPGETIQAGNYYYPDYTETDQGAAGTNLSVFDIMTSVGAVTKATIYFAHNSGAATTTYTFGTNEAITDNFNVIIEDGALLSPSVGVTLTINGHVQAGHFAIFSGAGSVVLGRVTIKAAWFGVYATDAGDSINKAIASLTSGGEVLLLGADVTYTTSIDITDNATGLIIRGAGKATILRANLATIAIDCTGSSDIVFKDFQLVGHTTNPEAGFLIAGSTSNECLRISMYNIVTDGSFNRAALYIYRGEEFTAFNSYFRNQENGATAYWDTGDNDGTGEDITSPNATIQTGLSSNTLKYFYGCSFHVDGTGDTDSMRLRAVVDSSWDGSFFVNAVADTGRSAVYIDADGAASGRLVFTNFRSEGGRRPDYGFYLDGTTTTGPIRIEGGYLDVDSDLLYGVNNSKFSSIRWEHISGTTSTTIDVYNLELARMRVGVIDVRGTLETSHLHMTEAGSTITATNNENVYYYTDTGETKFEALVSFDHPTGDSSVEFASAGTKKWTLENDVTDHGFDFLNAGDALIFGIKQSGIEFTRYIINALDDTGTPSVSEGGVFQTGGSTAITDFDDGQIGQIIRILARHNVTITDGAEIVLSGGANFAMNSGDTLTLIFDNDSNWIELSRGDNN